MATEAKKNGKGGAPAGDAYTPRLQKKYKEQVIPALMQKFGYKNVMMVPRLEKISVNMGVGEASKDIKELDAAEKELAIITGQKARTTRARKAISTFKKEKKKERKR